MDKCTCVKTNAGPYTFTNDFDCDKHNPQGIRPIMSESSMIKLCYHFNEKAKTCKCTNLCYCKSHVCKKKKR